MSKLNTATLQKIAHAASRSFTAHLEDCPTCQAAPTRYYFLGSLCPRGAVLFHLADDATRLEHDAERLAAIANQ